MPCLFVSTRSSSSTNGGSPFDKHLQPLVPFCEGDSLHLSPSSGCLLLWNQGFRRSLFAKVLVSSRGRFKLIRRSNKRPNTQFSIEFLAKGTNFLTYSHTWPVEERRSYIAELSTKFRKSFCICGTFSHLV